MTNHGDDCYFYYYSTCTKGDSCPFRHCEAAMGNETVCNLWQEGHCFRMVCKFRHMEIQKNRKEIPCYWENQPAGCQKAHCVFYHEKPRTIDGVFVPPSKGPKTEEPQHEEPAPPPAPLPAVANPQLRGVLKAETQETVPSPTHPPVVINPADDDEDEDDQFSEEGEDGKFGPDGTRLTSPRKLAGASIPALDFGVSTLEEIRLRKALKASMKRAGYPVQSADAPHPTTNGANRENIRSHIHPVGFQAREDPIYCGETERSQNGVIDRLGKRMLTKDDTVAGQPLLKRSLAERLGRVVHDEEQTGPHLSNGFKPVKERLGFQAEAPARPVQTPETKSESSEAPQQIHIKTLEEIRQEKASKSQNKKERVPASAPGSTPAKTISTKAPKGAKRLIVVKDGSAVQMKTFPPVHAKKKQEEDQQKSDKAPSPGKASQASEGSTAKAQGPPDAGAPGQAAPPGAHLRVKTLEEIRREKTARLQAQRAKEAEDAKSPGADAEEDTAKKHCPNVPQVDSSKPARGIHTKKTTEAKEKLVASPTSSAEVNPASSNGVKVKTFDEIMREKRLRKQELEEQDSSSPCPSPGSAEMEPPQKRAPVRFLKKTVPIKAKDIPPAAASPSSSASQSSAGLSATHSPPVVKRLSLKSKADSPSAHTVPTSTPTSEPQPSPADSGSQSPNDATPPPAQEMNSCSTLTQVKQTKRTASLEKSPGKTTEIKVRPKLNVKPSVIKPAAQVKPGQKRRLAARSAVAEVKPLNSTSTVTEESQCKRRAISPTNEETQPSPAVTQSPASLSGSGLGTSPAKEEPQTVPVFQHSPVQKPPNVIKAPASREACTVPQSPVIKTPTPAKPRRTSFVASRGSNASSASAVDDFDELMNEFTDDHLGEDMDPGMGEDDLLQELSEMIDS